MQSSVKGFAMGNVYASQNGIPYVNTQYKASILEPSKINMIVDNLLDNEKNKYIIVRSMNDKDLFRLKMNQIEALHKNNMENRLKDVFNQPLQVEKQMLVKPNYMPVRLKINYVQPNKKSVKKTTRSPKKNSKKRKQKKKSVLNKKSSKTSSKKSSKTSSKKASKSSKKTTSRKNTSLGKTIY
jgi:hypothetical protein